MRFSNFRINIINETFECSILENLGNQFGNFSAKIHMIEERITIDKITLYFKISEYFRH